MPPSRLLEATTALAVALGISACGSGEGAAADEGVTQSGSGASAVTFCSTRTVGSGSEGPLVEHEIYLFGRMNQRLERFPELREATGFDTVSSCEDAREFMRLRQEYLDQRPAFDDFEIADSYWQAFDTKPLPPPPESQEEVAKILNGKPGTKVQTLRYVYPNPSPGKPDARSNCTGTFIGDKWIVTAAHCLPAYSFHDPTQKIAQGESRAYPIKIHQQLLDGSTGDVLERWVVGIPLPTWLGGTDTEHDIALLHVYVGTSGLYEPEKSALGISMEEPPFLETLTPWGWGTYVQVPIDDSSPASDIPRTGHPGSIGIRIPKPYEGNPADRDESIPYYDDVVKSQAIRLPATSEQEGLEPRLCSGDSGGPLLRTLSNGDEAIVGIYSSRLNASMSCAEVGDVMNWSRIDTPEKRDWIENMMGSRAWGDGKNFQCQELEGGLPNTLDQSYMKCWRKACTSAAACKSTEKCELPSFTSTVKRCLPK